ncbi:UvrB/UvrC motif-containing protein [Candidatus Parcubacteria bacterium]|nr:UvrB/UvrC motif-containing protein [Candidatus Parcubacteria bacterium]
MDVKALKTLALPSEPGVYRFISSKGGREEILYVGKAASLKDRVRSYFVDDVLRTRGLHISNMVTLADTIKWEKTDSALEALLLEHRLIKRHQPRFNTREKDDKSFNCVVVTKEKFPRVLVARGRDLAHGTEWRARKYTFGPFTEGLMLREAMKIIRHIFPYRDSTCTPGQGKPCFNRQLGLCPGVCTGEVSAEEYAKTIKNIKLFFEGNKSKVLRALEKEMKEYARAEEFEKAEIVKRRMFALTHIKDTSLLKDADRTGVKDTGAFRIEAYDVAHLSGTSRVGVMAVMEEGRAVKGEYRKFRLEKNLVDDIAGLVEMLTRRFRHPEWRFPELLVVDGAAAQKNAAEKTLRGLGLSIPVAAVVKNARHKPERILGPASAVDNRGREILLANAEAHRFAITYHRDMRGRGTKTRKIKTG